MFSVQFKHSNWQQAIRRQVASFAKNLGPVSTAVNTIGIIIRERVYTKQDIRTLSH